jgi:hypothetical protein
MVIADDHFPASTTEIKEFFRLLALLVEDNRRWLGEAFDDALMEMLRTSASRGN